MIEVYHHCSMVFYVANMLYFDYLIRKLSVYWFYLST